jgi:hypothetical protein
MGRTAPTLIAASILLAACSRSSVLVVDAPPAPPGPSTAATLGIPPGHLPPPGECRVWIPGRPPGHQAPPGSCSSLAGQVPPGGWLVYRPSKDKKRVKVSVYDAEKPDVVVVIRFYDAKSGKLLKEERPPKRR